MIPENKALDLIKKCEGCEKTAYQDVIGIWTIGYGSTGPGIKQGLIWTQEQCEERLRNDLLFFEGMIMDLVSVELSENQKAALCSFVYNVGVHAFEQSTLLKKLNSGDIAYAADEFSRWNKAGGHVVNGLTRRRALERALFLS